MRRKGLIFFVASFGILFSPLGRVFASPAEKIVGVWECPATRPGSGPFTVYQVYHADGIVTQSSSSHIFNDDPRYGLGFSGRAGILQGEWEKLGPNLYRFRIKENVFRNYQDQPLAAGESFNPAFVNRERIGATFYVDGIVYHDTQTDTLCSGTSCPAGAPATETKVKFLNLGCTLGDTNCDKFNVMSNFSCKHISDPSVFPDPLF